MRYRAARDCDVHGQRSLESTLGLVGTPAQALSGQQAGDGGMRGMRGMRQTVVEVDGSALAQHLKHRSVGIAGDEVEHGGRRVTQAGDRGRKLACAFVTRANGLLAARSRTHRQRICYRTPGSRTLSGDREIWLRRAGRICAQRQVLAHTVVLGATVNAAGHASVHLALKDRYARSKPHSIRTPSAYSSTAKMRLSVCTGSRCASRAPNGATSMLVIEMPTSAGR